MSGIDVHKNSTRSNEENQVTLYPKMSSSEEFFLAGESRISKDRRRFTVVTVFDVCLTALLWVISTVSKGSDWPVITAVIRMFILILFYSILLVGHWLPVAITTIATTIFLLVKTSDITSCCHYCVPSSYVNYTSNCAILFSPVQGNLPQYTVLVSSFVVAWFQLWLVPFHILPRERRYMIMPYYNTPSELSERNVQTDEEFRSAMEYSSDSDDDNLATLSITGKVYSKAQYIEEVERAKLKAKELLTQISFWKLLHRSNPEIRVSKEKQIYYVKDTVACSPKSLFKIIWKDNKLWNKQITNFKVLLHIDAITELVYITTAPILRGYIAPRDFLDVRRMMLDTEKDIYEGAYISIDSPIVPINGNQKLVRGINGANYIRVTYSSSDSKMSQIEWIQDSDVKTIIINMYKMHTSSLNRLKDERTKIFVFDQRMKHG
ncbi:StAR-related lipid transfer protein 3 [Dirofilaria immitis]|nr:StAR-related lipid transfer protein 3 [Dirofilaria immitis]